MEIMTSSILKKTSITSLFSTASTMSFSACHVPR